MGDLKFTKLVVEIQFGVKWTVGTCRNRHLSIRDAQPRGWEE